MTGAGVVVEAGINTATAILNLPANNALSSTLLPGCGAGCVTCPGGGSCAKTTVGNGYALWKGSLNASVSPAVWTITSWGYVPNSDTARGLTSKMLQATIGVMATLTQPLNNPAWNFVYATALDTTTGAITPPVVATRSISTPHRASTDRSAASPSTSASPRPLRSRRSRRCPSECLPIRPSTHRRSRPSTSTADGHRPHG